MNKSVIAQIRAFFESRQAIVHSISIRQGKVTVRVDDDKLVGIISPCLLNPTRQCVDLVGDYTSGLLIVLE